jgi:hypothetical protein
MINLIQRLITLILAVSELVKRYNRSKEQKEHEEQQQQIKDNPSGWFENHFNGSRDDKLGGLHDTTELPRNAESTKQTNASESSIDGSGRNND